jgi:hypothetical protein
MRTTNPRRGGILGSLLFTAAAIVVLTTLTGIYVIRNVRVETSHSRGGDDVSIRTPGGSFKIRAHEDLDPSLLGIPVYPGAKRTDESGAASFEWNSADGRNDKALAVGGASLFTPDPPGKVLAWYRAQLPDWIIVTERGGNTRMEFKRGGLKRIVAIHEKRDGTHIGVASIGAPASN